MATFFNSQVWCSMKPLSITRARNTVQLPYQLPVLEPLYSRQTCQSPHALAMLSPLSSPSRNTAASPSGRTSLHKRPSLHNWHERRVSTDCGQRNRSGASHLCAAHARCWHDARCTCPAGGGGMCGHKARNVPTYVRVFAAPWPPGTRLRSPMFSCPLGAGQLGVFDGGDRSGVSQGSLSRARTLAFQCRAHRLATRKASSPSMRTTERNSVLTCLTSAR